MVLVEESGSAIGDDDVRPDDGLLFSLLASVSRSYGPVSGTSYAGPEFFDFVVSSIDFGPWFLWLAVDSLRSRMSLPGTTQL
jgi:hypothetical protein